MNSGTKKQKKGKTNSKSRTASQTPSAQASPQVLHINGGRIALRGGIRVQASVPTALEDEASLRGETRRSAAARCQQIYVAAHTTDAAGRIQLDAARLALSLAEAGIGVRAEQALYSLALMAAADGHGALFEEDVMAAIAKAS
jgi:hypothetical protein